MALLRKPVVAVAAAKLNEEMGEFKSISNKITPETKGKGSQIQVYVNRPSQVVNGVSIPDGYDQGTEKQVNIQLAPYFTTKWINTIEKTNDLLSEEEQLLANLRVGLQYEAKKQFFNLGLATANSTIAGSTGPSGLPIQMVDIAKAIARVKQSGVGGKVHVLIPSDAAAYVAGSQWSMFTKEANEKLFNNDLGSFYGAEWHETIVNGVRPVVFTTGVTVSAAAAEGDTTLTVSGLSAGLVPAGTQFTIAGVNALDIYGNDTGVLATFATIADVVATGTNDVLPIGKALFTNSSVSGDSAAKFNAGAFWGSTLYPVNGTGASVGFFSALPASGAALTQTNGNKNSIIVYSELAMAFAAAAPNEMARKEEYLVRPEGGIPILVGVQGTNEAGVANYRMDAIWGLSGVYAPGAVSIQYTP